MRVSHHIICAQSIVSNGATVYAIVGDRLSALELARTPDMGHNGWANDVTLSHIHDRAFLNRVSFI